MIFPVSNPSQIGEPSHEDELLTQRLKDVLALVDVRVIDHLIVAGTNVVSFAEKRLVTAPRRVSLLVGRERDSTANGKHTRSAAR